MTGAMTTGEISGDPVEQVVLLDEAGMPVGVADKATVHTASTPLHLAFSCYLFDADGRVLVTRRALSKATWPGVWTNSLCGHPAPGESAEAAIERRAHQELGTALRRVRLMDPTFRYRAVDAGGLVENEICPVYEATVAGDLRPVGTEVAEWEWVDPAALVSAAQLTPFAFSPWCVLQLSALAQTPRFQGTAVRQPVALARMT